MKTFISAIFAGVALAFSPSVCIASESVGNVVFLGDSITQGGSYLAGPVASYRYPLFKNFVDNGIPFQPMGTTRGAAKNVDVSKQTPAYRGFTFPNVSESAASARSYQYAGHYAEKNFKPDPKTAFPPENRGPVTIKLGQKNPFTGTLDTFYDGVNIKTYSGDTYKKLYGNAIPDTLCVLIGINDIFDKRPNEAIAADVHKIIKSYQVKNPKIRVHVFEVLPTGKDNPTGTNGSAGYLAYNAYLRTQIGKWSTSDSRVSLDDISTGFYAEDGSMIDTARGTHPNAQGELILAGNIARVLGIGQRNCGFPAMKAQDYQNRIDFEKRLPGKVFTKGKAPKCPMWGGVNERGEFINTSVRLSNESATFKSDSRENAASLSFDWFEEPCGKDVEFDLAFRIRMLPCSNDNIFTLHLGNGDSALGFLSFSESAVFWNFQDKQMLYGTKSKTGILAGFLTKSKAGTLAGFLTKKLHDVRITHRPGEGFYVWLNGQLIGERLPVEPATIMPPKSGVGNYAHFDFAGRCEVELSDIVWTVK